MSLSRRGRRVAPTLLLALFVSLAARPARAQSASGAACPPGNLIAGQATPWAWTDLRGRVAVVTDGVVAPEGAMWDAPPAVVLDTGASAITFDLGAPTAVRAIFVQADANDEYTLFGSLDGRDFRPLAKVPSVVESAGHGLRRRTLTLEAPVVRFLRIGEGVGDGFFSLSEIQAFCQVPQPFPPALKVVSAPAAKAKRTIYDYWNDETSARWELGLAVFACLLVSAGLWLRRRGQAFRFRRLRDGLLVAVGLLSFGTYFNFGFFHFGNWVHNWDVFHYYVGAKYFRELGYERLYECVAIADAEDGLRRRVELRKLTNLRTNVLETTADILAHPERCKSHFSEERWRTFKSDVAFFRAREGARRWDDAQTDHGYNATPVWNIAGSVLSNTGQATKTQVVLLTLLDPAYLIGACLVIWWAFGWRVLSVALAVFATNFPSRFYWTGGAFLRWDWIFYMVAAIACLKKDRPLLGGLAIGYATLLRVFPGLLMVGPLLLAGYQLVTRHTIEVQLRRFFVGAAIAVAVLVPLSAPFAGGFGAYKQFVQNTVKHKETPLTNYMGLRTVVAFRPKEVGRRLRTDALVDPWSRWKAARIKAFQDSKPVYYLAILGYLALVGVAVRRRSAWAAAALGATFCAFGVELTSYYYAFLIAVALLYAEREEAGALLLLATAVTQFIAWAPLRRAPFFMPTWLDEQYTWMSLFTIVAFVVIAWLLVEPTQPGAPALATGPDAPTPTPPAGGGVGTSSGLGAPEGKRR
jgi:hypothetical protein